MPIRKALDPASLDRPEGHPTIRDAEAVVAAINLQTRKPVDQLNLDDFRAYPVWEDADDEEGRDETRVRPVDTAAVAPDHASPLVGPE